MIRPKRLLFAGGGTRCLAFVPALERLDRENALSNVVEWWGTSAGSLVAAVLAITKSTVHLSWIIRQTDFTRFRDMSVLNLVELTTTWGLDDGASMSRELMRIFEIAKPGSSQYCMRDVVGLHVVVADLNLHQTVVISSETFPSLRIVDAVRASMSLPIFYRPYKNPVNGNLWVDGGLRAHFPWYCLRSDAERRESLGFSFQQTWIRGPSTFSEYLFSMLHFDEPVKNTEIQNKWNDNVLWFESPPFPAWYVRLMDDDYAVLEKIGADAYETWIKYCSRKTGSRQSSSPLDTPAQVCRLHHTDGKSDIPECPDPPRPLDPSRDSPPTSRRLSRRWSW
jgi:predicted acylesterase/phospholipase RssA